MSVPGTLRVWHLGAILITFVLALYGAFFFLPTMIHAAGISRPLKAGPVTAIPYTASIAMMIGLSRHSDRSGERRWHLIGSSLVGALGMVVSVLWNNNVYVVVAGMSLTVGGVMTTLPVFWGMATGVFRGASEAVAIAFINSLGLIAGFDAPSSA